MRLLDILKLGERSFKKNKLVYGHGTDNAWDEAVWIAFHVLKLPFDTKRAYLSTSISEQDEAKIKALYTQRIETRLPTAYLVKEAWLQGLSFYVDRRTIIPRSPIAELIKHRFYPWIKGNKINKIIDLCTGSACLAILAAQAFPKSQIIASDISRAALKVAQLNIKRHQMTSKIKLIESNIFKNIPRDRYDIIISNPPYVSDLEYAKLPQEYHHEPRQSLKGGRDGLKLVDRILMQAKSFLAPHGLLIIELGYSKQKFLNKYPSIPFIWLEFECGEGEVALVYAKDLV